MEPSLTSLESKAAEYIVRLSREEKFDLADPMERATLAYFLAAQMVRTRAVLETQADRMARMTAWLKTQGAPDGFFEDDPNVGGAENADKALLARLITSAPRDLAPAFVEKDWLLVSTPVAGSSHYAPNLNLLASRYSPSSSIPTHRRPSRSATMPAVLEPANGSTTRSPSSVSSLTKNSGSAVGKRAG